MCLTHFCISLTRGGRVSNSSFSRLWRWTRPGRNCHSPPTSAIQGVLLLCYCMRWLLRLLCCYLKAPWERMWLSDVSTSALWCENQTLGCLFGFFFPPSLVMMDELSFRLQITGSDPLNQSFPPCKGKKTIWNVVIWLMKCGVGKSINNTFIPAWSLEVFVGIKQNY